NVFNEAQNPKQDTTAGIGPAVDLWMHAGRSRLSAKVSAEYLYFKEYDNQRAWNTTNQARWEIPLAHVTPFVAGSYANTKNRAGYEIDSRARQSMDTATLGAEIPLSGKTSLLVAGHRSQITFDNKETYLGADLAHALNETVNSEQLQLRYRLTPLTTFVVNGEGLQDRFTFDRFRNADSIKVRSGFEMKPSALISGRAMVG